jgi:hypothetical protein
MEQTVAVWCVIPKGLKAKVTQLELDSVHVADACQLTALKKRGMCFLHGTTDLFNDWR